MEEIAARAAHDVIVAFSRLRRRLREVAALGDLTPSQTSVLDRLGKEGPASTSALANVERVRPQSMAATVAALEEQGFVSREPDPDDGRRQLITLTDSGRERVAGTRQARQEWLVRVLRDECTDDEQRTLVEAMAILERLTGA